MIYVHAAIEAEEDTADISNQVQPEIEKRAVAAPCISPILQFMALSATISFSDPIERVQEEIRMLQERFNNLKRECVACMQNKRIPLDEVVHVLKSLPADDTEGQLQFIDSHVKVFSQTFDYSELFGTLGFHMNYLSCQLLEYMVNEFDLEEVLGDLAKYKSSLQQFCIKTPVKLFSETHQNKDIIPPPNFRKLVTVFNLADDNMTLEDLEQLRRDYSYHYGFHNYTMTLAKTDTGPLTATWFIPESVYKKTMMTRTVPRKLLFKYSVLTLQVDGGFAYRYHLKENVS